MEPPLPCVKASGLSSRLVVCVLWGAKRRFGGEEKRFLPAVSLSDILLLPVLLPLVAFAIRGDAHVHEAVLDDEHVLLAGVFDELD